MGRVTFLRTSFPAHMAAYWKNGSIVTLTQDTSGVVTGSRITESDVYMVGAQATTGVPTLPTGKMGFLSNSLTVPLRADGIASAEVTYI